MIEQEPQPLIAQQPSFPVTNINITQEGLMLTIHLAPGLTISQGLSEDAMHQITLKWLETHEALMNEVIKMSLLAKRQQLELIHSIQQSRND